MKNHLLPLIALLCFVPAVCEAAVDRQDILLTDAWTVKPLYRCQRGYTGDTVTLPHTWNVDYAPGEAYRYDRDARAYQRTLTVTPEMAGRRLFLYFEGANSVATVFLNRRTVGEHKGGYTAFCLEITDAVHPGDNLLEVFVSNAYRTDVLPISGDFNVCGGLHRPVHLLVTDKDCINPCVYASPGVLVRQKTLTDRQAELEVETFLSLESRAGECRLRLSVADARGRQVAAVEQPVEGTAAVIPLKWAHPHKWQGKASPYLYTLTAELLRGGEVVDWVTQSFGLRSVSVDSEEGFFLNGRPYDLHGFNRHDDFQGYGSALREEAYQRDKALIDQSGATFLRLAHYPHNERIYEICDSLGIALWTEIPFCGPGGYMFTGYMKAVEENALQCAKELVYQKFNHPSIVFWGLFNELLVEDEGKLLAYDPPVPFVTTLNDLFHSLDPTRPTAAAICSGQEAYEPCCDVVGWNKYFAWDKSEQQAAGFFDEAHATGHPTGISEYGRGGSPLQHADPVHAGEEKFPGTFHPEEYQAICHEGYWAALKTRKYLPFKAIWQFSDMQSCIKDEGDTPGRNDKGMVTYDRKTLKDAYYFYQANWTEAPMLHLCSQRFVQRTFAQTSVRVYTTLPQATLWLNGQKIGTKPADDLHRIVWDDVTLQSGDNFIEVRAGQLSEQCCWHLQGRDYRHYARLCTDHVCSDFKEMYREGGDGAFVSPYLAPGSKSYAKVLWDWDSWLSNVALEQILAQAGSDADRAEALRYERGCVLNFLAYTDPDGYMPIGIDASTDPRLVRPEQPFETNMHKPVLAQHAAFLTRQSGGDASWLSGYYDRITAFLDAYKTHYRHEETGLYYWKDDMAIGVDTDPATFFRPAGSSASIYLNCLMYRELLAASYLSDRLGQAADAQRFADEAEKLAEAVRTYCWDERDGMFYSVDINLLPARPREQLFFGHPFLLHEGGPRNYPCLIQRIGSWTGFMPLWAGIATPEQAERMVRENLCCEAAFLAPYGVRTLAKTEKMYNLEATHNPSNWNGPIWGISNYMVFRGLVRYGLEREARDLVSRTVMLYGQDIERNGALHEYYDPESGEGIINPGFQNWNYLVVNMIAWADGQQAVSEF